MMKIQKERQKREFSRRDREKSKKWREKDKRVLFERVKEKYLMFRKMRVNLLRVDPTIKLKKSSSSAQRKRSKKRDEKKPTHIGGCRAGLRSKNGQIDSHQLESLLHKEEDEEEKKVVDNIAEDTFDKQESTVKEDLIEETVNEECTEP